MISQPNEPEDFAEAAERWDLERLYADLAVAKEELGSHPRQGLTPTEKTHLRGLLCGYSPIEIAKILHKSPKGVYADLTKTLYRYIEIITKKPFISWKDIIPGLAQIGYRQLSLKRSHDWHLTPDVSRFFGRTEELASLQKWILTDRAQLVALFGMGGIGKTALAGRLAQQIAGEFEYVGWRSLSNTPTVPQLLTELLGFFPCSPGKTPDLSPLLHYIQTHRSLIILDGLENLLTPGELAGKYREAYQEYALLFKTIGTTQHQSCFIITSTEKSREIGLLENFVDTVQCLKLTSLSLNAARQILQEQQLVDEDKWEKLIERYSGNPLALKLVSGIIKEVFHGQVGKFCRARTTFLGEIIRENLAIQLSRLSDLEMQIIYQLAISSEPVDIDQLRQWVPSKYPLSAIIEALKSLIWRSLLETVIEQDVALYILPPMFRKHIINNFTQPLI